MNSSGIKRGLAGTAVAALAVTGLPFLASSASAAPLSDFAGGAESSVLYSLFSGEASVADGSVHLLAGGGASVTQIRFQYATTAVPVDADYTTIATVNRANGGFSYDWTVPTALYNTDVTVRAVAIGSTGNPTAGGTDDTQAVTIHAGAPVVDIAGAPGQVVPVFAQPYTTENEDATLGVVSGTTSDVSGSANVELYDVTTGTPGTGTSATLGTPASGSRTFAGMVDFSGYTLATGSGAVNQAVVGAETDGSAQDSDDAEIVNLTSQSISSVTAEADPATVQGSGTSTGKVTVLDGSGNPVAGAQVFLDADNDGVHDGGETFQYTNANGVASFTGLTGTAGGTQYAFVVNTTDGDDYESAVDYRRTVTVTSYTAAATSISAASADGAAFDFDEYDAAPGANGEGDITVTVKDQNGNALPGATLSGSWTIKPFDGSANTTVAATITDADSDGIYNVAFPGGAIEGEYTLNTWIERGGNPGQGTGDLSATPLTFKAGEANIVWEDGATAQAPAGTTATVEGVIELDDGTALAGRNINIAFTKSTDVDGGGPLATAGDAEVAAQASQPTGTTRVSSTQATAVSGDDGTFGVAIVDPSATPQGPELNGTLVASSTTTPGIGANPDASDSLDLDFLSDSAVSTTESDTDQDELDSDATPGRPVHVEITVENAAGTALTDLPVTVSTDHGFFTTPDATDLDELEPDPAAAEGALYGEWEDLGDEYETTTDDSGYAQAVVAIEGDEGFNDDGEVTAEVTFEVGGKTFTEPVVFTSDDPLNGGEVNIVLNDDQDVSVLPKAPTTELVGLNAQVTDQWGNLVDGESVDLTDDTGDADLSAASVGSSFEGDAPDFYASADAATDQTITGTWEDAPVTTWTDAVTDVPGVPATIGFQEEDGGGNDGVKTDTEDITGESEAINWYVIDYAASSFTLVPSGSASQPVGTTVTMTYTAVDQNGEPLEGYDVVFYRTGPDDLSDGDGNSISTTNGSGKAFYVFQGAKEGTATVTAVLHAPDGTSTAVEGELIPEGEQTAQVEFKGDVGPVNPKVVLKGKNNGGKKDKLKVDAIDEAAGATAVLFKGRKEVATKLLRDNGNAKFVVKDTNGKKKTKYTVKVRATDLTTKGKDSKKIR